MKRNRHYWQLILFVAVLIVPSVLVAWQGWRIVGMTAQQKIEDAQNAALAEIGSDLRDRLENIRFQAIGGVPASPFIRFVGWVDGEKLIMPWQTDPNAEILRDAIKETEFSRKIDDAEQAELGNRLDRASDLYRELMPASSTDTRRAFARLRLAAVLKRSTAREEANGIYQDLLSLPPTLVDQDGLSFASTAGLALAETAPRDVFDRAVRDLQSPAALSLDQAYRWRLVLGVLQNSTDVRVRHDTKSVLNALSTQIEALQKLQRDLEHDPEFQGFQKDFAGLRISEKSWQSWGGWLISRVPMTASFRSLIVAVQRRDVFEAVRLARRAGPSLTIVTGAPGRSLDEDRLPGVKVQFGTVNTADLGLGPSYYTTSILLVLSLTLFGGYLLWRDTRREVRVAELRSQFVASVSHELKTPLTAIRMFGEILQNGDGVDAKTQMECVDTIVNESERLTRLLNNVLDFSRIEHGQKSYRLELTRPVEVVAAAAKTMQYPLAEQGFNLKMEIDEQTPAVEADRDALKQAVLNLLTNAMKYSGQSRQIALRLLPENGHALIQVSDLGIGIPEREQSRIFEKFYRVDVRENQSISGTGLGLALVAHIVEGHRGTVRVESSPGAGSTFSIRIPVYHGGGQ